MLDPLYSCSELFLTDAYELECSYSIIALVGAHELTIAKQDYTKTPGEVSTFLGFKPEDPAEFKSKQLKELKNGRLAMIAVLGELMAQQVSGYGTYEQLGLIIKDLPLPL